MRYMGIDFGSKRVGIALSDERNLVAFPHSVLANDAGLLERIGRICSESGITDLVLGESKDFQGGYNKIMEQALAFKAEVEAEVGIPVALEPEFMTSVEARRSSSEEMHDAASAALILQSFLDKKNNKIA